MVELNYVGETATQKTDGQVSLEEFEKQISEELPANNIRNGAIVVGKIIDISSSGVYVDLGYKTDGLIPIEDFRNGEQSNLKVGDKIKVFIKNVEDSSGQIILSYRRACELAAWDKIQNAHKNQEVLECVIKEKIKGGFSCEIDGIKVFLPQSQVLPNKSIKQSIGSKINVLVIECNRKEKNVIVSEKGVLEKLREKRKEEIFKNYKVGDLIKGTVSRIVEYGVFLDLGNKVEGLIHKNDLSWSTVNHPKEVVKVGQELEVKILKLDPEKSKIALGLKQTKDDPWLTVEQRYEVGQKYKGKVKNIMDFGAFVELEEGIEGLVHLSELSWNRNIKHPSEVVKSGDIITVLVKEIDKAKKRIALSYKETLPHPWDGIEKKFKVGDIVKGKVTNIVDYGAFVEVAEGVEGLLHISDLDWIKKINHPKEVLEKGQIIEVKILNLDPKNRRLSLGLKQVMPDPWSEIDKYFKAGDIVSGVVRNIVNYGAFVQLENGLEGLLHVSELSWDTDIKDPHQLLKVGDQINVYIYEIDKNKQKIALSLKRITEDPWKGIEKKYPMGSIVQAKIIRLDTNAVEVEIEEHIKGTIPLAHLSSQKVSHPSELYKEGDQVFAKVIEIDRKNRKVRLSIKEALLEKEQLELLRFKKQAEEGFNIKLGDVIGDKLQEIKKQLTASNTYQSSKNSTKQ